MKNLLLIFLSFFCLNLMAQDAGADDDYIMFESIILTPNPAHVNQLAENMAAHNAKYHKPGTPHEAYVYHIANGPNTGKIVWMMGPCNWADLDTRPSADGHDEDWATNVVPLLNAVEQGEYWKRDAKHSKNTERRQYPIIYVRYHEISSSEGYRFDDALAKISATMNAMEEAKSWSVYDNQFRQGYKIGRHVAMVSGMDKWAELDEDWPFVPTFEEVHGKGSFNAFSREMERVVTNTWDEIWTYDAKMSGKE